MKRVPYAEDLTGIAVTWLLWQDPKPYWNYKPGQKGPPPKYNGPVPSGGADLQRWQQIQCNLFVQAYPEHLAEAYWLVNGVRSVRALSYMAGAQPTVGLSDRRVASHRVWLRAYCQ